MRTLFRKAVREAKLASCMAVVGGIVIFTEDAYTVDVRLMWALFSFFWGWKALYWWRVGKAGE